jgi:hypothetical protein
MSSSDLGFKLLVSRTGEPYRQEIRRERWILKHSLGWERRGIISCTVHSVWKWCVFTYPSKEIVGTPFGISALDNQSVSLSRGKEYSVRNVWGKSGCKSRFGNSGEEVNFCSTLASDRTGPPLLLSHTVFYYVPTLLLTAFYTALLYIILVHVYFWCVRSRKLQKCANELCRVCLSIFQHVITQELVTWFL